MVLHSHTDATAVITRRAGAWPDLSVSLPDFSTWLTWATSHYGSLKAVRPRQALPESHVRTAKASSDVALEVTQLCPLQSIGAQGQPIFRREGAIQGINTKKHGSLWGPSLRTIYHKRGLPMAE